MATYITAFVTLFVVIDPIGLAPIFIALTPDQTGAQRRRIGARSLVIAAILLTLFGLTGDAILSGIGISISAFRIAGGLLLFLTALDMLFERRTERREGQAEGENPAHDPSVFPLAMPLAYAINPDPFYLSLAFGAVLGGAVFGDQCSPISDTTILASLACGCDVMDHVLTQLPLALAAATVGATLATVLAMTVM